MLSELTGRRALVTGASGGLGPVIARALHARGALVVLSGRRVDALEALAAELGENAEVEPADLSDRADLERMVELSKGLDVLVANAALPASGWLEEFSPEQIDRALDVNLRAPIRMARAAAPEMAARGGGSLVFVSSLSGKMATAGQSLYSATKYGLRGFAFGLHQELRDAGVGVTTVFPGFVSGAGMFADTGLDAPRGTGTSTPEQVAAAVLRGIETRRAEIDVAPLNVRLGVRAHALAPSMVAAISRRLGAADVAAQIAERQREKR
ncbi:MAG: SDR family NAD(P)-dependent oxidoreductase [Thermoleophilaceae bacterium]